MQLRSGHRHDPVAHARGSGTSQHDGARPVTTNARCRGIGCQAVLDSCEEPNRSLPKWWAAEIDAKGPIDDIALSRLVQR